MNEAHQYKQTDDERAARLPVVMKRYAKDIDKHGEPMDSGLADVLRFAADRLAAVTAERDALKSVVEKVTELMGGLITHLKAMKGEQ